ncbi:hypothetical protein [Mumia sp.]|uniref:hypothetical protein n=1 Tax=Mumia sp. TaxID=1965300 RepID=UPI002615E6A7|nr:hypothetical protein [Mumia sp.]MDD9347323.1 hypothetical protein [Mumia sp.]
MRASPERSVPRPLVVLAALVFAATGVALITLAIGLGSVGVDGHGAASASVAPPPRSPTAALEQMLTALGREDVRAACEVAAPDGFPIRSREALARCEGQLRDQLDDLDRRLLAAYRGIEVRGARVDGNSSTVHPRQIAGAPVSMGNAVFALVEAGGVWYVIV